MPTWPGQRPPPVSGVSCYQAFLCCPFPAPHSHRSPRRQRSGRASRASCDGGEAYRPGRAGPGRARQHPGPPKGASGTSSPRVFAVCGGCSTSRREHGHHGRLGTQSVSPSLSSTLTEVKYSKVYWASLVAQTVKCLPAMRETWFDPWVGKIPWRRE